MRRSALFFPFDTLLWKVLLAAVLLQGCRDPVEVNLIQSVSLEPGQTLTLNTPIRFIVGGVGSCDSFKVDWGEGRVDSVLIPGNSPIRLADNDLLSRTVTHTFTGWGGGKTVTVEGNNCGGKVAARFDIPPASKTIPWAQPGPTGTNMCQRPTSNWPIISSRSLVKISANTVAARRDINFGCPFESCVYNADGKGGSVADANFPFPGMREYSVVYRVGSQLVQGGTQVQFITTGTGTLEFCLNDGDKNLGNNTGGFNVIVSVDQLGPP